MPLPHLFNRIAEINPHMPGWCSIEKAVVLAATVITLRPKIVVEIGVFGGRSLLPMAMAMRELQMDGMVIGIDPWDTKASMEEMEGENKAWWEKVDHEQIYRECMRYIDQEQVGRWISIHRQRSDEYKLPARYEIDLLHIDGSHGDTASCYDVKHYGSRVRTGGILVMDDIGWAQKAYARLSATTYFRELYKLDTGAVFQRL